MKLVASVGALLIALPLVAQQPAPAPAPPPPAPPPLTVGTVAPDFTLPAATSAGVSAKPFHLQDHRGETVVLAFFFRARTSG